MDLNKYTYIHPTKYRGVAPPPLPRTPTLHSLSRCIQYAYQRTETGRYRGSVCLPRTKYTRNMKPAFDRRMFIRGEWSLCSVFANTHQIIAYMYALTENAIRVQKSNGD